MQEEATFVRNSSMMKSVQWKEQRWWCRKQWRLHDQPPLRLQLDGHDLLPPWRFVCVSVGGGFGNGECVFVCVCVKKSAFVCAERKFTHRYLLILIWS